MSASVNHQRWLDEVKARGAGSDELAAARDRMSEDQPSGVREQLDWLRAAGFAEVSCPFQRGMFAVFSARKA